MLERIRNQITELRKEEERRYTYEAEFSFSKELPVQYSEWMNTIWDISNRDKIKIYLVSEGGESFDLKENVEEEYAEFLKGLESDETVEVSLTIDKKIVNGYLSVYCFEKFAEDISSLPIDKVLTAFSNFMKKAGRSITFELFDSRDMFYTKNCQRQIPRLIPDSSIYSSHPTAFITALFQKSLCIFPQFSLKNFHNIPVHSQQ